MEEIGKQNLKSLRSLKRIGKKWVKGSYKSRVKQQEKDIRKLENNREKLERKKLAACGKTKAAKAEQKNLKKLEDAKEELKRLEGEKALELVEDDKKAKAKAAPRRPQGNREEPAPAGAKGRGKGKGKTKGRGSSNGQNGRGRGGSRQRS